MRPATRLFAVVVSVGSSSGGSTNVDAPVVPGASDPSNASVTQIFLSLGVKINIHAYFCAKVFLVEIVGGILVNIRAKVKFCLFTRSMNILWPSGGEISSFESAV